VAEMVKLLENTFRSVNIGLVNELAMWCDKLDVDVWEVVDAAATKPFGFMPFRPGPGLGGHCIPIDPLYLAWKLRSLDYPARFITLASEINMSMPHHVLTKVARALNDDAKAVRGSRLLIMGVAYKPDISDVRESPALDLIGLLLESGGQVAYHDPYVPEIKVHGTTIRSVDLTDAELAAADCVVIETNHSIFEWGRIGAHSKVIVDTRNAMASLNDTARARIVKL
jgi:UDP-N-acetyl-D-glucosamine dehydrogenase